MVTRLGCRRIGITMRVVEAEMHPELRDALAHDWTSYMDFALPGMNWMPVPNLGGDVVKFIDAWQLDGLILSGGNDIGENSLRDTTERLLLEYFIENGKPVLGSVVACSCYKPAWAESLQNSMRQPTLQHNTR